MLKNYDFWLLEVLCFSGIDHHLAPDCCHRNLTENRIWLCITNFLNKQSKSLRKKSKNSGAAAPLKISREKKQRSQFDQKTLILWFRWWCFLLKENPTTKLKNELLSLKKDFSQTKHNTKKHWNLKNNRQNLTSNLRLKT